MKTIACCLVVALALGCSYRVRVSSGADALKASEGRPARVTTQDGTSVAVRKVTFTSDGSLMLPSGQAIAPSLVENVAVNSHAWGAWHGAGLGLLTGFVAGYTIGMFTYDESPGGWKIQIFSRDEHALLSGGGVGLLGALTGALIGGGIGATQNYVVGAAPTAESSRSIHISAMPTDGGAFVSANAHF